VRRKVVDEEWLLMIKTILVGLDGSEHARTAMRYAVWLGERLHATVIGLHVVDIVSIEGSFFHDISGSLGFEPYLDFSSKMREVLHERGKGLLQEFRDHATKSGVRFDTVLSMGVVANEVAEQARMADLVVIGHRGLNERFSTGLLGSTAESVTRKCPQPVLISTATFRPISRALLAYDGSERAASATHAAAEFCVSLSLPLTVLTIAKDTDSGEKVLGDARKYLASYSLDTRCVVQTGHAPEQIVGYIKEQGFDLLFIGAYGHSRIIEMVLGSTTEYVLRNTSCPVFLNR
jgi:nucleotide-binding universal stress UspA family protein